MKILLGIDVGTSSVKVVATDSSGAFVADAARGYPTVTDGAAAEQDANAWWEATRLATTEVTAGHEVIAVAVTSQAPTIVPVDDAGSPTAPALTWLDRRAEAEAREIAELVPDSRNGADPFFGTAKLPWLARHRPGALSRSAHVLAANGFIVNRLSGIPILDDTTASLMQGFDEQTGQFSETLRSAEPTIGLLPPIVPATQIIGTVTAAAASATGITQGAPVVAGGIDSIGSAIESGVLEVGDPMVDMSGFSSVTILPVAHGTRVPGFLHCRHCIPGVDLLLTAQVTAGATIDWVNGFDPSTDFRDDTELLSRYRPSRLTMVTSLAGERTPTWNAHARGTIDGIDLATDGYELMLAAMEGNALALARDVKLLREAGYPIDRLISTGGGSASRAWLQIKADVLGVKVDRPASGHGAAQGAAVLAGMAIGTIDSLSRVRALSSTVSASFQPEPTYTAAYAERSAHYARLTDLNASRG